MHWHEKIQLIKSRFSAQDFTVPMVGRKHILRKIESAFISRPMDSLELNTYSGPFRNWWNNIRTDQQSHLPFSELQSLLKSLNDDQNYWLGCENRAGEVWLYKSKPEPAYELMKIGQTWVNIYHLISTDCSFLLSIKFHKDQLRIKQKMCIERMTD